MAEQTDRLLNDVVIELKTTNRLIEQGNKDPSLPSSIKQNAGEIGNAILLAGRSERFQKQEGVTKVDEGVEKLQQSNQTLLQDILGVVSDIQTGQQAPSILKSKEKRDAAQANRLNMSLKDLGKKFGKYTIQNTDADLNKLRKNCSQAVIAIGQIKNYKIRNLNQ